MALALLKAYHEKVAKSNELGEVYPFQILMKIINIINVIIITEIITTE